MSQGGKKDLVVWVADRTMEAVVRALLETRTHSIPMRTVTFDVFVFPGHDPQARLDGAGILNGFIDSYEHGVLMFDHEGSGAEDISTEELEAGIDRELGAWQGKAATIAIDPELEVWVWGPSRHVAEELNVSKSVLDTFLSRFQKDDNGKPVRPKETFEQALWKIKRPRTSSIYKSLAENVSLDQCSDRAFRKFCDTLSGWFPPDAGNRG